MTWHGRGDYFASVMPRGDSMSVLIHQLSRRRSQVRREQSQKRDSSGCGETLSSESILLDIDPSEMVIFCSLSESLLQVQRINPVCSISPGPPLPVRGCKYMY